MSLILKKRTDASVPTPAVGKAAWYLDSVTGSLSTKDENAIIVRWNPKKMRLFVDPVADYGATFDHKVVFDGACSTGAPTKITSATAAFVATDNGKRITLAGAGASGAMYVGTITAIDSATQVTVSPSISTTVSAKGLQWHTDDLTAWTNLINDVNASTFPGAVIKMEGPMPAVTGFTNRSGISGFLPTITKQVVFDGIAGSHTSDIGDYTKAGGSCIAYVGVTSGTSLTDAVMKIAPPVSASGQALKRVGLRHFWIDCRNGDQNEALKGISLQSCHMFDIDDVFVVDALAVGIEFVVVGPGNASALGEAKDITRGHVKNWCSRQLDNPSAGAMTTPILMTSAVVLTTTPQSLTVAANTLPASGFAWVETANGYPVLFQYTGGGGTTTLTGCVVSAMDAINAPTTVNGSNVVQAVPGNACCVLLDGDTTANANLSHFDTVQLSHGTTWGPAAMEFRNCDSIESTNVVVNGGNHTNDGAINRIRKPGVRFNGSNSAATLAARNNVFRSGDPGAGGVSQMGVLNTGSRLLSQAQANYWDLYQLGNGAPIPDIEGNAFFYWTPNGGLMYGADGGVATVNQAIANTLTLITGTLISIPPQGFQVGTVLRWTLTGLQTAAAVGACVSTIRIGTAGTTADAAVLTITQPTSTVATATGFKMVIEMTIRSLGAAATVIGKGTLEQGTAAGIGGATQISMPTPTTATFNSTTAQQFVHADFISGGAGTTVTFEQAFCEVVNPANP